MTPLKTGLLFSMLALALFLASCATSVTRGGSGATTMEGLAYIASREGRVFAINLNSRSVREAFPAGGEWISPTDKKGLGIIYATPGLKGDTIYIATFQGQVYALDARTGALKGEKPLFKVEPLVAAPLITDTALFVPAGSKLYAFDLASEQSLWQQPFSSGNRLWATPILLGDKLIFGSLDHKVYAVYWRDGTLAWSWSSGGGIASSPVVVDGVIYIGSFDGQLHALNAQGQHLWAFPASGWLWQRPLFHEGKIYIGSLDGVFYAVDAARRELLWRFTTGGKLRSAAVAAAGVIVVATTEGRVYGFDAASREMKLKWPNPFAAGAPVTADLAVWGEVVLVHSQAGVLYALKAQTGEKMWDFTLKQ